jgi:hypothetical protein
VLGKLMWIGGVAVFLFFAVVLIVSPFLPN